MDRYKADLYIRGGFMFFITEDSMEQLKLNIESLETIMKTHVGREFFEFEEGRYVSMPDPDMHESRME
jgi:hypothetical protein